MIFMGKVSSGWAEQVYGASIGSCMVVLCAALLIVAVCVFGESVFHSRSHFVTVPHCSIFYLADLIGIVAPLALYSMLHRFLMYEQ